jgi:hypothetical protein
VKFVADALNLAGMRATPCGNYGLPVSELAVQLSTHNSQLSTNYLLHPCVELNLRRTMGHVALSIPCDETMP